MIKHAILRVEDSITITKLLFYHLKTRWKGQWKGMIATGILLSLGAVLPFLTNVFKITTEYGYLQFILFYQVIFWSVLLFLCYINDNFALKKLLDKISYCHRSYKFMEKCYKQVFGEYQLYKEMYKDKLSITNINHDSVVVKAVFDKIFQMYFNSMNQKMTSMEGTCLIKTADAIELFSNRSFLDYYSKVIFIPKQLPNKTPYESVIAQIINSVMNKLYKKKWFCEYYDEDNLIKLVRYLLNHWFSNIIFADVYDDNRYSKIQPA